MLTMLCYILGSLFLSKSLKWARVINPVILTVAFMLERPVLPVYSDYYEVFNSCINVSCCYLIPWFVCETMAGQVLSFLLTFCACVVEVHYHFDFEFRVRTIVPYSLICIVVYICFSYDLPIALKTSIRQQLIIKRKNGEFNQILSSIPAGIMLASINNQKEIKKEI